MLRAGSDDSAMVRTQVFQWFSRLKRGESPQNLQRGPAKYFGGRCQRRPLVWNTPANSSGGEGEV
jgi:hypothetical protein